MTNRIVFAMVCVLFSLWLAFDCGYNTGKAAPKQCASVQGQQVVSTTADTCTYANSFGRATTKRRAG